MSMSFFVERPSQSASRQCAKNKKEGSVTQKQARRTIIIMVGTKTTAAALLLLLSCASSAPTLATTDGKLNHGNDQHAATSPSKGAVTATDSTATALPHIVFVLVDDFGWAEVGYHRDNNTEAHRLSLIHI